MLPPAIGILSACLKRAGHEIDLFDTTQYANFDLEYRAQVDVDKSKADMKVVVGYDEEHFIKSAPEGDNIIYYLARIIDICRINNINILNMNMLVKNQNLILVDSPIKVDFLDFDEKVIKTGFEMGCIAATKFALKYFTVDKNTFSNLDYLNID